MAGSTALSGLCKYRDVFKGVKWPTVKSAVVRDRASERGKPGWASGLLPSWKIWAGYASLWTLIFLVCGAGIISAAMKRSCGPDLAQASIPIPLLTHSSRSKGLRSHGTNQKELAIGSMHQGSIGLLSEHDQIPRSAQASSEDPDVLSDHTA